jgi:DNA-binding transcriptional LysR family regulator
MEMRHLRYFIALAEQGNFRRAAERLGIAQPPLSRQIRALERELGCRLVVRTSRGVELTAAGRVFLEQARVTLAEAQRAVDRARVAAPETSDTLVIGCEPATRLAVVGRVLARIARGRPGLRIELHDHAPTRMVSALRDGLVHAAIVALPLAHADPEIVIERIAEVPLCLAVTVGHPLAGPRPVSWRRLADTPLVLFEREVAPALFDLVVATFQQEGVMLRPRHRTTTLSSALTLVEAGLGVTVLPSGWQPSHGLGLACRPLRPPSVTMSVGVAHRRDASSPALDRVIAAARAATAATAAATSRVRPRAKVAS